LYNAIADNESFQEVKTMPVKQKASGGKRIKEQGRSLVWVTLDDAEKVQIRTAAGTLNLPMSQFLKQCGLAESGKILREMRK
jgi:hypothetical protein